MATTQPERVTLEYSTRQAIYRLHEELHELPERALDDPARDAKQLRATTEKLTALALVYDMAAQQEKVAS